MRRSSFDWAFLGHLPVAHGRLDAGVEKVHSQIPVLQDTDLDFIADRQSN